MFSFALFPSFWNPDTGPKAIVGSIRLRLPSRRTERSARPRRARAASGIIPRATSSALQIWIMRDARASLRGAQSPFRRATARLMIWAVLQKEAGEPDPRRQGRQSNRTIECGITRGDNVPPTDRAGTKAYILK